MPSETTTTKIEYLQGSRFVEKHVEASDIRQLRTELDNRADQPDSYLIQEGDQIAAVVEDKTGGQ